MYYNSLSDTVKVEINCAAFILILSDETIVTMNKLQLSTFIRYVNHKGEPEERFFFSLTEVQIGLLKPYLTMVCTIKEFTFRAKLVRQMMVQLSWWATYLACRNKFQECIHSLPSLILKSHIKYDCNKLFVLSKKAVYTHFSKNLLAFHHFFDTHCALMPLKNLWEK
jgi:hypothetical protein